MYNVLIAFSARTVVRADAANAEKVSTTRYLPGWAQGLPMDNTLIGKREQGMKKIPVIDLGKCTECDSCIEICPEVFKRHDETGLLTVVDLPRYPEEEVNEAIITCPADCIRWETKE